MVAKEHEFELPEFITERWGELTEEYVKLVFSQAEKRLAETVTTAISITSRAYTMLGISCTILTLIFGYLVTHTVPLENEKVYIFAGVIVLLLFGFALWQIVICLKPFQIDVCGSEPKILLNEGFIQGFPEGEQLRNILLSEIKSYQERINNNHSINRLRMEAFYNALKLMAVSPLSFPASWVLLELYSQLLP